MSYKIKIENRHGEQLELTNNPNYNVKATGLSPVNSNIITSPVANYGGEKYKSSRKQKRNIVLTIYIKAPVEANRINLYKYIKSDDWIRVYFKNNARNVYIDGYVESFNLDHFSQTQTAQVSIICPQPNFIDTTSNTALNAGVTAGFYFAFNSEVVTDEGTELHFNDLDSGVVNFTDFLATPETNQSDIPSPTNPVDITGLGELNGESYYTKLNFESGDNLTTVKIPLGAQTDGVNLIHGGLSLVSEYNFLITTIYVDSDNNIYVDSNNNIIYR